jgi:alpha-1,3-rhamnosyl/mannosyltransferase
MRRRRIDVFHGTNFEVPYLPTRPSVLSLHDLSPWMDPEWHSGAERVRRRTPLLLGLGIATMILTDSEAVRRQAIGRFRLNPSRVAPVPLASAVFPYTNEPTQKPAPGSIGRGTDRYFLFVGTLEPRKNLPFLINAWAPVYEAHGVELLLAGRRREDCPPIPPRPGLRLLGEVADTVLPRLYSGALAFVYPSSYEGFGLPVLEAMHCGCCVIVSRDPAIEEVCADCGVRVDAADSRGWTQAMMRCAARGEWIDRLREQARIRARSYSWARTARLTYGVYQEACARFV